MSHSFASEKGNEFVVYVVNYTVDFCFNDFFMIYKEKSRPSFLPQFE
jgi:hypothetical protein